MKNYIAKVVDGSVECVTVVDGSHSLGPDEVLVGSENTVGIGWSFDNGTFSPPQLEPFEEA